MKAIVLNKAGGVENLMHTELPLPVIEKDEVLIKVKSISINPVDVKTRASENIMTWIYGEKRPVILGWDVSGEIVETGVDVTGFKNGDPVFGLINFFGNGRGYCEYVAAPANQLAVKPANISHNEAAAATLTAVSAWQALVTNGKIKKGDRVLIHAASGGVGHFAVQIAKLFGAHVIATSSGANKAFVMSLKADEHIDYTEKEFNTVVSDVDFVLDTIGGGVLLKSIDIVRERGTIITLASHEIAPESITKSINKKVALSFMMVQSNGEDMKNIAKMLERNEIKSHVSETYFFKDMDKAHLKIETGRAVGKIIVTL